MSETALHIKFHAGGGRDLRGGEVIQATVTFSETVTGAPQLTLKVGAWTERRITSVAGNDLDTDGERRGHPHQRHS